MKLLLISLNNQANVGVAPISKQQYIQQYPQFLRSRFDHSIPTRKNKNWILEEQRLRKIVVTHSCLHDLSPFVPLKGLSEAVFDFLASADDRSPLGIAPDPIQHRIT
jgi:hypothetical protein